MKVDGRPLPLYLTTVLSDSLKAVDTSVAAWRMALKNRAIQGQLLFHSDRGVQYACTEFRDQLKSLPVVQSMTGLPEQSERQLLGQRAHGKLLCQPQERDGVPHAF